MANNETADKLANIMEELIEDTSIECPGCIAKVLGVQLAIDTLSSVRGKAKKDDNLLDAGIVMLKGIIPSEESDEEYTKSLRELADFVLEKRRNDTT